MGENSGIQWTRHTFNPWVGCQRVSPGCENCYAESYDRRVGGGVDPSDKVKRLRWGPNAPRIRTSVANWKKPLAWNRGAAAVGERHRVFCASLADVFEDRPELVPWRADLFDLIDATPSLDWLVLTKRPENIARLMPDWLVTQTDDFRPKYRPNVWLGTTVEDRRRANERIPHLLAVPAAVRFLSMEPLIESVDIRRFLRLERYGDGRGMGGGLAFGPAIDWVIIGGESGGKARPFDVAWARDLVKQCRAAGVAPFVKQLGSRPAFSDGEFPEHVVTALDANGYDPVEIDCAMREGRVRLNDSSGGDPAEWPLDLRVREFPEVRR